MKLLWRVVKDWRNWMRDDTSFLLFLGDRRFTAVMLEGMNRYSSWDELMDDRKKFSKCG